MPNFWWLISFYLIKKKYIFKVKKCCSRDTFICGHGGLEMAGILAGSGRGG